MSRLATAGDVGLVALVLVLTLRLSLAAVAHCPEAPEPTWAAPFMHFMLRVGLALMGTVTALVLGHRARRWWTGADR